MEKQNRRTTQNTAGQRYLRILPALERLEDSFEYDVTITRTENDLQLLSKTRDFLISLPRGHEMDERKRVLLDYADSIDEYKFHPARCGVMVHFLFLRALNLGKDMILEEVLG